MSVQSEINRIASAIADAYDAVVAKGGTLPATLNVDALAAAIASITGGGGVDPSDATALASDIVSGKTAYIALGKVDGTFAAQTKSVTPTTSAQTVTPDSGKYLTKVSVGAIPSDYIKPSGTLNITANGTHNVKNYASAAVNVPVPSDYYKVVQGSFVGGSGTTRFEVTGLPFTPVGGVVFIASSPRASSMRISSSSNSVYTNPDSGNATYGVSRTGSSSFMLHTAGMSLDSNGVHTTSSRPFDGTYHYVIWGR